MSARSRYIIRGGIEGRERLRVLARAMHPATKALFDRVAIPTGARCLDVGCGGGDVSLELARRVGSDGRVVGIDLDEAKLALARDEADRAGLAIEYRTMDLLTAELEPAFDIVYARFLLTHLVDPLAGVNRLVASLRPGGTVIVEDIDVAGSFCHPESDAYRRYVDLYSRTARARSCDPDIGRRLPKMLLEAGCEANGLTVVQPAGRDPQGWEGDVKLVSPLTMENVADSILAEGLATREEIDTLADELYRLAADPGTLMSLPRIVQAWGRRPSCGR